MNELKSPSYMKMGLHLDGKEYLELQIPTFWDEVNQNWVGAIKTPTSFKLICATGKDSFELQNNFNVEMSKFLHDDALSDEVFSMFKPKSFWEDDL